MCINNLKFGISFLILILFNRCQACVSSLPASARHHPQSLQSAQSGLHANAKAVFLVNQQMANNLTAAPSLQDKYSPLRTQVKAQAGSNQDPAFVGIEGMKGALRNQSGGYGDLAKFKKWAQAGEWNHFHSYHYDWWMFPIDRSSSGQGMRYTVYQNNIEQLKADTTWLKDYRLGAVLLLQSWGWDVANKKMYPGLAPDQKWQNWDVRLGKLGHSLILFEQWDLYAGVEAYVQYLLNSGVELDRWVLKYFPDQRSSYHSGS